MDDENKVSLHEHLEQRITLEMQRVDSEIKRIDKSLEVFRQQYEDRHERLREEVDGAVTIAARQAAIGADRRWIFATSLTTVVVVLALIGFLIDHFAN